MGFPVPSYPIAEGQGITTVNYCILDGFPEETLALDASQAVITYRCAYRDRYQLANEVIGFPWYVVGGGLLRHLPEFHPEFLRFAEDNDEGEDGGQPWLFATKVLSIKGLGEYNDASDILDPMDPDQFDPSGQANENPLAWISYKYALVTVLYESVFYDVKFKSVVGGAEYKRFVTKRERSAIQAITVDRGLLVWDIPDKEQQITHGVPLRKATSEVEWVWHDVPDGAFDWSRIQGMRGKINGTQFDIYQPETLLLEDTNRVPRKSTTGVKTWEITFKWLWQPYSHNKFIAPGVADPVYVKYKETGDRIYPEVNFNDMFTP